MIIQLIPGRMEAQCLCRTQTADYPTGKILRQGACASVNKNSSLVVFTGGSPESSINTKTNRTFAYDVNSNTWKLGPNKPTERNLFYMAPIVYNDSVYLVAMEGNPPGNLMFVSDVHEWLNLGYYQIPTGISENNFSVDANLFPNPASNATTLSLNLKSTSQVKVIITDIIGNTLMNVCDKKMDAGKNTISIQTKKLARGMYFCLINFEGTFQTKKLFKN